MKILAIALEKSANIHLEKTINSMDEVELFGIFDEKIICKNKTLYCPFTEFNAMGFVEVLPLVLKAKKAIKELVKIALEQKCDKVLLIDSPAFNIPFAKALRKAGFSGKIVYFILPQVWAWKKGRIKVVESLCDELVGILPFENQYFKTAKFFGNPSANSMQEFYKSDESSEKIIAFLAGSRKREITSLMPIFREIKDILQKEKKDYKFVICMPDFVKQELYGDLDGFCSTFDTHATLKKAEFAFVCSGTASLETGLIGTAFCLCYKARMLDYLIAKSLVKIKFIGLCNIIFDKLGLGEFHDEFIQNFSANDLIASYKNANAAKFLQNSRKLRECLKGDIASNLARILKEK